MKKWLPIAVAGLVGVIVAGILLMPSDDATTPPPSAASMTTPANNPSRTTEPPTARGGTPVSTAEEPPTEATPEPARPPNQAEVEADERSARPFNQHYYNVSAFWNQTIRLVAQGNPALGQEVRDLTKYMRDVSRLNDDEVSVNEALQKELDVITKIRSSVSDPKVTPILDYIEASAKAAMQGQDPTQIAKPRGTGGGPSAMPNLENTEGGGAIPK